MLPTPRRRELHARQLLRHCKNALLRRYDSEWHCVLFAMCNIPKLCIGQLRAGLRHCSLIVPKLAIEDGIKRRFETLLIAETVRQV